MHKYNNKFYKEHGFKVTYDNIDAFESEEEKAAHNRIYNILTNGIRSEAYIPVIQEYIRQFPNTPSFKTHLVVYYKELGMYIEAKKVSLEIINLHPDYIFGRISLAEICIKDGNLDLAKKMLGEPRNIKTLKPNEDIFSVKEFMAYYCIAGMYEAAIDDRDAAEKHLELLIDFSPESNATKILAQYIMLQSTMRVHKRTMADKAINIHVKSFPTYTPEPTEAPPKLRHKELEAFYLYATYDLPEEIMTDIMQLPRETLIADLEAILEDGIRRDKHFRNKYAEGFNESGQNFMVHAMFFLAALDAKESLNSLLNVFRQGEAFIEYWFINDRYDYFNEPLFFIAKDQEEALKNYALEPNQYRYPRSMVPSTLTQFAIHFPEKRGEIIEHLKEIYDYHLARPDDKGIIDTRFLSDLVGLVTPLHEIVFLDYARKIDECKWYETFVYSTLENIEKETRLPPEPADRSPMPQNIYEFYNRAYRRRKARHSSFEEIEQQMTSKVSRYLLQRTVDLISEKTDRQDDFWEDKPTPSHYEYQAPAIRAASKVGRNAPCPCGSGKKHKRCCLKKAS